MKDEVRLTHMDPDTQRTLARTKAPPEKNQFADAVLESFTVEFGKVTQAQIARLVGWKDGSRLHQVISSPHSLDTGTIRTLINPLQSKENRSKVVKAWVVEAFGQDYTDTYYAGRVPDEPTKESLNLVHKLMIEGRIIEAASVCLEIYQNSTDESLKEAATTRHFYTRLHANEIGFAMMIARSMIYKAKESKSPGREAYGHLQTLRVYLELPWLDRENAEARLERAHQLINISDQGAPIEGHGSEMDYYELKTRLALRSAELESNVPVSEIRELRDSLVTVSGIKMKNAWDFWIPLLAAKASIMLGDRVLAADLLEKARSLGSNEVYHADPEIGLVHAEIIRSTGNMPELYEYLNEQSWRCYQRGDALNRLKFEQKLAACFESIQ